MSASRRTLPERPSLEQQKKLAKELLTAFQHDDPDAVARVRAELPDKAKISLTDAQFVLAREYGFKSWSELSAVVKDREASASPAERFKSLVENGDVTELRAALARDESLRAVINEPLFGFDSPALAANNNNLAMVDALLDFGADPNRKTSWWAGGFHPLYGARRETAARLLAAGAVADACAAASMDRADLLKKILHDDPSRVHERGGDGQTPLHFARSREIADILIGAGADLDARDVDHRSTAAEWMAGDRSELAEYLVDRGASADIFLVAALGLTSRVKAMLDRDPTLLDLRTSQGEYAEKPPSSYHIYQWTLGPNLTPPLVAAKFGHPETVAAMLPFTSPVQQLLLACHEGRGDEAHAVVRAHPGIVESLTGPDAGALTAEAWAPNAPAVALMMELGFDPSAPITVGPTGGSALHCAAWEGSPECVAAILKYPRGRALIHVRDGQYEGTPLDWCAHGSHNSSKPRAGYVEVERLLRAAGARE
jgi:ankyrin repeat protein